MIFSPSMTNKQRREAIRQLDRENERWPSALTLVPVERWLPSDLDRHVESVRVSVWRSCHFLVQVFSERGGIIRLSVNRTTMDEMRDRWAENISWDDLQRLKNEAGFADRDAVEVFPVAGHEVNVANMRHLWILPEPLPFVWRKKSAGD